MREACQRLRKTCGSNGFTLHCPQGFHARLRRMSATSAQPQPNPTPILDRLQPMPNVESRARRTGVSLLIWFLLVIAAALTFTFWPPSSIGSAMRDMGAGFADIFPGHSTLSRVLILPFAFLASFVAIAIHETAHALIGVLAGFRFNSLRIGRLQI